jgi:hypothetical protein
MPVDNWVPVEEFPGYSVNQLGQVRKDSTERVLHTRINQYGVPYVGMMRGMKQHIRSLPRLVAIAFLPTRNEIFDTPINLDGDRTNCHVDNLMWRPRWYAIRYFNQFDERYDHPIDGAVRAVDTGEQFPDSFSAGCRYGLLEREVVLSILNNTLAWPTYQRFELLE